MTFNTQYLRGTYGTITDRNRICNYFYTPQFIWLVNTKHALEGNPNPD